MVAAIFMSEYHMAASLLLGFFALLRPANLYGLRRDDIMLADKHPLGPFLLPAVREPKTRWRGGKQQYVRIDLEVVVCALSTLLWRLPAQRLVWPMSPSRFTRRLQFLARSAIGNSISVLPSSLQTGGATRFLPEVRRSTGEIMLARAVARRTRP